MQGILNFFDEENDVPEDESTIVASESASIDDNAERAYEVFEQDTHAAMTRRNAIAEQMWNDYIARRQRHPIADL